MGTCNAVAAKIGLVAVGNGKYEYTSVGGVNVKIERTNTGVTITLTDASYPNVLVSNYGSTSGAAAHHINAGCNTIEYIDSDATIAKRLDEIQPDGETSTYELTGTSLLFYNIYMEDTPGNKVE